MCGCRIDGDDLVVAIAHPGTTSTLDIAATSFAPQWELLAPAAQLGKYLLGKTTKADMPTSLRIDRALDEETATSWIGI